MNTNKYDDHLRTWLGAGIHPAYVRDFRNWLAWERDIHSMADAPADAWPTLTADYWQCQLDMAAEEANENGDGVGL